MRFQVDNRAVVVILTSTYSKESHLMHLIRLLVFMAAKYNFWFVASHISGRNNPLSDALSRNKTEFFSFAGASDHPSLPTNLRGPALSSGPGSQLDIHSLDHVVQYFYATSKVRQLIRQIKQPNSATLLSVKDSPLFLSHPWKVFSATM